jgi:hypothetical protein
MVELMGFSGVLNGRRKRAYRQSGDAARLRQGGARDEW